MSKSKNPFKEGQELNRKTDGATMKTYVYAVAGQMVAAGATTRQSEWLHYSDLFALGWKPVPPKTWSPIDPKDWKEWMGKKVWMVNSLNPQGRIVVIYGLCPVAEKNIGKESFMCYDENTSHMFFSKEISLYNSEGVSAEAAE